jgi:hypothetical protein
MKLHSRYMIESFRRGPAPRRYRRQTVHMQGSKSNPPMLDFIDLA